MIHHQPDCFAARQSRSIGNSWFQGLFRAFSSNPGDDFTTIVAGADRQPSFVDASNRLEVAVSTMPNPLACQSVGFNLDRLAKRGKVRNRDPASDLHCVNLFHDGGCLQG